MIRVCDTGTPSVVSTISYIKEFLILTKRYFLHKTFMRNIFLNLFIFIDLDLYEKHCILSLISCEILIRNPLYTRTVVDAQTAVTAAVGQSAFRSSWDVASVYFPTMFSEFLNTL